MIVTPELAKGWDDCANRSGCRNQARCDAIPAYSGDVRRRPDRRRSAGNMKCTFSSLFAVASLPSLEQVHQGLGSITRRTFPVRQLCDLAIYVPKERDVF